ncbi:hypothetical protein DCAR_0417349 [Daucus carota subsp. sativus]|uniref:Dirigent protein n=1 Tax=Daucus carota subsp. sativus TaxID=79200 RepID=A0A162ABZ2_DAUCS|nr:PREDICTED: dirigent protein 21-like [Daucus carota subsp. sativus]WOG98008.1 hypothetical protein DCAR_0417349 [Daucus carota subsp. sativus]
MSHTLLLSVIFAALTFSLLLTGESQDFTKSIPSESLGLGEEKLSHLHFYLHDIVSGRNATAIRVATSAISNTSATRFSDVLVIDDLLTVGPDPSSKQLGRAQGIYTSASLSEVSLLMAFNYVFTVGKYNGSTLSILGRNPIFSDVREMPVVGGSGVFRFARGYAQARTHFIDWNSGDAVVEYNVYVFHY